MRSLAANKTCAAPRSKRAEFQQTRRIRTTYLPTGTPHSDVLTEIHTLATDLTAKSCESAHQSVDSISKPTIARVRTVGIKDEVGEDSMWKWTSLGTVLLAGSLYVGCAARTGGLSTVLLASLPKDFGKAAKTDGVPKPADSSETALLRVVGFGHIDVEGGTVPLNPAVGGQVEEVHVKEGEHVAAGQTLVQLNAEPARLQLSQAELAVQEARIKLLQSLRAPSVHDLILRQQEQSVAAAESRLLGQKRQIERLERLSNSSAVAPENLSSAQDRGRELDAAWTAEKLKLDHLKLERPQELIDLARANHAAAELTLNRAKDHVRMHALSAAEPGVVLRIAVAKGQMAGPNAPTPAIWFCPDRQRVVRCEIDQEFADSVRPGLEAEISMDGVNPKRWRGKVQRCSDWIASKRSLLDEPFQKNDVRTLECIVVFDSGAPTARIGQKVRVALLEPKSTAGGAVPLVQTRGTRP